MIELWLELVYREVQNGRSICCVDIHVWMQVWTIIYRFIKSLLPYFNKCSVFRSLLWYSCLVVFCRISYFYVGIGEKTTLFVCRIPALECLNLHWKAPSSSHMKNNLFCNNWRTVSYFLGQDASQTYEAIGGWNWKPGRARFFRNRTRPKLTRLFVFL